MGRTVVRGAFEWDEDKNRVNIRKHGISFREAVAAFSDPYFFEVSDEEHSTLTEQRFLGYGMIRDLLVVTVVYTERNRVRIISARNADDGEEEDYYERRFGYDTRKGGANQG